MSFWDDPLASESIAANEVKKNEGINVIIGNPPYAGESSNKGEWILSLMEDYKYEPGSRIKLQEANSKFVNDDYVKFIVNKEKLDNCCFNIILVDDDYIHKLNKEYRNIDRVTDVISFALEDSDNSYESNYRVLGDIYISVDTAYRQALEYNHSNLREICFLATHGILHLLGYDHMEEDDEIIMFKKQEELLNAYKIQR